MDWGKVVVGSLLTAITLPFNVLMPGVSLGPGAWTAGAVLDGRPKLTQPGVILAELAAASRELEFAPGHPLLGHAYVAHPIETRRYVPMASFHSVLFEEKASELVTLLASLGVTRLRVTHHRGYRSAAGIRLTASEVGSAQAQEKASSSREAVFEETYTGRGEPRIPSGGVWFNHEPTWRAIARRRLEFGLKTFDISLNYSDDYGTTAELKATLEGVGVSLGGKFTEFESTEWRFAGEFSS